MSSTNDNTPRTGTVRTRIIAGVIGAIVLVLIVIVAVRLSDNGSDGEANPSPTKSSGSTPSADPSAKPGDKATGPGKAKTPGASGSTKGSGGSGGSSSTDKANTDPPKRVTFSQTAKVSPALSVEVTKVESVRSRAVTPGETSRPSLRITVSVSNNSNKAVKIGSALTNLYYGPDRSPANTSARPGGKPFPAKVPPGGKATGVYVFNVPVNQRGKVVLEVSADARLRRVEFAGDCSGSSC